MIYLNNIIKYLKIIAIPFISIIVMSLFLSISNMLGFKTSKIVIMLAMVIVMLISGYILAGKVSSKKYLHGLLLGIITSLLFLFLSIFFKSTYNLNTLIYYLIIILSSTFGSMLNSVIKHKN